MRYGSEVGPKEVVIPEQRFYSCHLCKFYEYKMEKSDQRPLYSSTCRALDINGNLVEESSISGYKLDGEKTPDCCPYLKSNKRNDKIDKII